MSSQNEKPKASPGLQVRAASKGAQNHLSKVYQQESSLSSNAVGVPLLWVGDNRVIVHKQRRRAHLKSDPPITPLLGAALRYPLSALWEQKCTKVGTETESSCCPDRWKVGCVEGQRSEAWKDKYRTIEMVHFCTVCFQLFKSFLMKIIGCVILFCV